jgi:hypothetical protein
MNIKNEYHFGMEVVVPGMLITYSRRKLSK